MQKTIFVVNVIIYFLYYVHEKCSCTYVGTNLCTYRRKQNGFERGDIEPNLEYHLVFPFGGHGMIDDIYDFICGIGKVSCPGGAGENSSKFIYNS